MFTEDLLLLICYKSVTLFSPEILQRYFGSQSVEKLHDYPGLSMSMKKLTGQEIRIDGATLHF